MSDDNWISELAVSAEFGVSINPVQFRHWLLWVREVSDVSKYSNIDFPSQSSCYTPPRLGETFEDEAPEIITDRDWQIVELIGSGVVALGKTNLASFRCLRISHGVEKGTRHLDKKGRIKFITQQLQMSRSKAYERIAAATAYVEGYVDARLT